MSGSQGEHEAHEAHEAEHEDFKGSPQLFLRASFVSFVAFVSFVPTPPGSILARLAVIQRSQFDN